MHKKLKSSQLTFIDLFAGCGGLSLGLEKAGFFPLYVNELNKDALETYLINRDNNYPHLREKFFSQDIKKVIHKKNYFADLHEDFKKYFGRNFKKDTVDLVVGGPPCQGFSGIGVRRSYSVDRIKIPSNHLFQDMVFFIKNINPKIFLFENVKGLLTARWTRKGVKGEVFKDVLKTFKEIPNYQVKFKLVYSKDYGVPQNRPRILIIGVHKDIKMKLVKEDDALTNKFIPKPDYQYPNIDEVLSDLVDKNFINGGETLDYPSSPKNKWQKNIRKKSKSKQIRKNRKLTEHKYSNHSKKIISKFTCMIKNHGQIPSEFKTKKFSQKVLPSKWGPNGPTITITSLPDDYIHFTQPRSLTVREWARLQTFPDWYQFSGKRTTGGIRRSGNPLLNLNEREVPKYTQIGNAVPVKLAYELGKHFSKIILKS